MDGWNFGDILDATAANLTRDRPALIHEKRIISWKEFDKRSNNIARFLLNSGLKTGDRVAFYHRNGIEYPELLTACFKARLVHVNINYRYKDSELAYILKDSGAACISFDNEFAPMIDRLHSQSSDVKVWLQAGSSSSDFAHRFEEVATTGDGTPLDIKRSPDDTLMIYTGGTTGMPKGVVWSHHAMRLGQLAALAAVGPAPQDMEAHKNFIASQSDIQPFMPACPWMHGTGLSTAVSQLCFAQPIVTVDSSVGLNADGIWRAVADHKVHQIAIVGDAFAKPMLASINDQSELDVSSLKVAISSGAMWSQEVKAGFLERIPDLLIADMFGASETMAFGVSFSTKDNIAKTATIILTGDARVITDKDQTAQPGETGVIAIRGSIGNGYFGDDEKTADTYRVIDGERWCVPGDFATVQDDGSVMLLGRGSNCINTAGEKVFPEEVEEVLKLADGIEDALVVGVADEKWGNAVVAVVKGDQKNTAEEVLRSFVKGKLAAYKAPKKIIFTDAVLRGPNGKADYKVAKAVAEAI